MALLAEVAEVRSTETVDVVGVTPAPPHGVVGPDTGGSGRGEVRWKGVPEPEAGGGEWTYVRLTLVVRRLTRPTEGLSV